MKKDRLKKIIIESISQLNKTLNEKLENCTNVTSDTINADSVGNVNQHMWKNCPGMPPQTSTPFGIRANIAPPSSPWNVGTTSFYNWVVSQVGPVNPGDVIKGIGNYCVLPLEYRCWEYVGFLPIGSSFTISNQINALYAVLSKRDCHECNTSGLDGCENWPYGVYNFGGQQINPQDCCDICQANNGVNNDPACD